MLRWACGTKAMQRHKCSTVRLLREIVGVVRITEIPADRHDVGLGRHDEPFECVAIARLGVEQESGHLIHAESVCRGNQTVTRADRHIVESTPELPSIEPACRAAREYLSARADDQTVGDEPHAAHVTGCERCAAFGEQVALLNRTLRLRAVQSDPDFVARVMRHSAPARLGRGSWMRPALAWCGVVIGIQSLRPLLLGEAEGAPAHVARHVGAAGLALAIGFVFAAVRPGRASGLLPYVGALFGATVLGAVVDTLSGDRSAVAELTHVAEMVGIAILWLVAGAPGWSRLVELVRSVRHPGAPNATN